MKVSMASIFNKMNLIKMHNILLASFRSLKFTISLQLGTLIGKYQISEFVRGVYMFL